MRPRSIPAAPPRAAPRRAAARRRRAAAPRRPAAPPRAAATLFALAALCLQTSPMSAQVIRGRLIDDATLAPIDGATLTLLNEDGAELDRTLSNDEGVFILDAELGPLHLEAERIGYRTTRSLLFEMQVLDTLDVEFRIDAQAVLIAPILVTVGDAPGRDLFDEHVALGEGFFYTPELLDSIRPEKYVAEIFRARDRRTWTKWSWGQREDGTSGPLPIVQSYLGHGCLNFVVDRIPVAEAFFGRTFGRLGSARGSPWGVPPLSDLTPEDVVAVEVYRAPHELPEGFTAELRPRNAWERQTLQRINRLGCGVVVFWTKEGWG